MNQLFFCNLTKKPKNDGTKNRPITRYRLFNQAAPNILKIKKSIFIVIVFLAFTQVCKGQAQVGDYRSKKTGNWSLLGTWEKCTASGSPGTWSSPDYVPNSTSSGVVTIQNLHKITLIADAACKDLIINTGGSLVTKTLTLNVANTTINGTITIANRGKFIVTSNAIINGNAEVEGGGEINIGGNLNINNGGIATIFGAGIFSVDGYSAIDGNAYISGDFIVKGDATLSGTTTVEPGGVFRLNGKVKLNSPDCLILNSVFDATGSFTFGSKDPESTGNAVVERLMSDSNNWHLYSSPLSGETIHDFLLANQEIPDLLDGSGNVVGVGMREYNIAADIWGSEFIYDQGLPVGNIEVGRGYNIRTYADATGTEYTKPGSVYAHGTLNLNDVSVPLAVSGNRWNCIGNPFTSAINIRPSTPDGADGFLNPTNLGNLDSGEFQAVYVWDTNNIIESPSKPAPAYVPLNLATSISSVQIGQGFFVKSNINGKNVVFTKAMQSPNSSLSFKAAVIEWPSLTLIAKNQTLSSSTEIKFVTNTTKGLDPGYDAGILKKNQDFALYSKLLADNKVDFCLQCLPNQNYDQYVIPIGIDCKDAGEITFTAETVNLPSGCQALLEDRLTNRFTRLDLCNAKYTAYVSTDTKGTGRFFLHTSDVISSDQSQEKQPFKVSVIDKTVYINGEVSNQAKFFIYSVNGKQLAIFSAESQVENRFDASGFPAGIYILSIIDKIKKKSIKFVIEN